MAGLFDILNVSPAERVQPTMPTGLQGIAQTLSGVANRGVQQAAGQDTRTVEAKLNSAMQGADTTTKEGLVALGQRLDSVGEGQRAAAVRQAAAQMQRDEEAKTQKEALSAFIAGKYPDLAGISDSVTLQQATAYATSQKEGEITELQLRMIDYFNNLGQADLAAGIAAGEPYTPIARESNDRLAAADETGRVRQPTSSELGVAKDIVTATGVGNEERWWFGDKKPTEEETTLLAMQLWTISQDNKVSLVEAGDLLARRLAAAGGDADEDETSGTPDFTNVVID